MAAIVQALGGAGGPSQLVAIPLCKVATCSLAQQALDFKNNVRRINESIQMAASAGAKYRMGPELEISGYGCEDHFYEMDTVTFSWLGLKEIMEAAPEGILCDIGTLVIHEGVRYNCRVFFLKMGGSTKILLIRPKLYLAEDGNYREGRYFTGWSRDKINVLEEYVLPDEIAALTGQRTCPIGVGIIEAKGVTIASEICEELFTPESPNIWLSLEGVDIMSNGSGSHFQIGKRSHRQELIRSATDRNGGVYMYANQLGCDGGRLVFDGNAMIYQNGKLLAAGQHLSFHEVEMTMATVNLNTVRTFRAAIVSRNIQSARKEYDISRIKVNEIEGFDSFDLTVGTATAYQETAPVSEEAPSLYIDGETMSEYEEMGVAVARYLWDYMVRSAMGGFFLPLSGGVDSSSTAMLVYVMCNILTRLANQDADVRLRDLIRTGLAFRILSGPQNKRYVDYFKGAGGEALDARKLMNVILHTANMPTQNNTAKIRNFAELLADALGSYHIVAHINDAFTNMKDLVKKIEMKGAKVRLFPLKASANKYYDDYIYDANGVATGPSGAAAGAAAQEPDKLMNIPRYRSSADGDWQSNLSIQNIQARLRMLTAYYCAQILPAHRYNQEAMGALWQGYFAARAAAIEATRATDPAKYEGVPDENMPFLAQMPDTPIADAAQLAIAKALGGDACDSYKKVHTMIILAKRPSAPGLLVLASSNSDEAIRGFFTKYDAGSADINPIGSFSKGFVKKFLTWCANTVELHEPARRGFQFNMLDDIVNVVASPELTPTDEKGNIQDDEIDIEMTYEDLRIFGELRKRDKLGPLGIFQKMCEMYYGKYIYDINTQAKTKTLVPATPAVILKKVKTFFRLYGTHRNKMTILTPSIHATNYSPDDNRFDHRPYLVPIFFDRQMEEIQKLADAIQASWNPEKMDAKPDENVDEGPLVAEMRAKRMARAGQTAAAPNYSGIPAENFKGGETAGALAEQEEEGGDDAEVVEAQEQVAAAVLSNQVPGGSVLSNQVPGGSVLSNQVPGGSVLSNQVPGSDQAVLPINGQQQQAAAEQLSSQQQSGQGRRTRRLKRAHTYMKRRQRKTRLR
jgi:predicted amidohydrolase/NH3-dependent NAD+ synthetase